MGINRFFESLLWTCLAENPDVSAGCSLNLWLCPVDTHFCLKCQERCLDHALHCPVCKEKLIRSRYFSGNDLSGCCRKGEAPYRAPRAGSYLTLGKELSEETRADKARDFIGKGHPGGEQEGQGTQENYSASWLEVLSIMVMGLVSGWSLASHSNSESFLVAHASLSQDGC